MLLASKDAGEQLLTVSDPARVGLTAEDRTTMACAVSGGNALIGYRASNGLDSTQSITGQERSHSPMTLANESVDPLPRRLRNSPARAMTRNTKMSGWVYVMMKNYHAFRHDGNRSGR